MLYGSTTLSEVYEFLLVAQDEIEQGFFVHDAGRLLYATQTCARISGYTLEELKAMESIYALVVPEERELLLEHLRRSGESVAEHYESAIVHKDGRRIDVEIVVKPLQAGRGHQAVLIRDITERKRAERDLKESEQRFRQLFEQATDALLVHDEEGKVVDCNREACRSLGYSREELLALRVQDFVSNLASGEERVWIGGGIREHPAASEVEAPTAGFHLAEHRRKDGTTFPVEVRVDAVDYGGKRMMLAACRDITGFKRAAEVLKESEERFRSALENASTGVALEGLDRRYLKVNRALCALLGYEEEELLAKASSEITHPEDLRKSEERTEQLLSGGAGTSSVEKRYIRKDGSVVWAISDVSLIRDAEGNPSHFVSQFRDITDRKSVEEKLRETQERYRALVEEVPAITYVHAQQPGGSSTTVYISPQIEALLGYTPEEYTADPEFWTTILHPEDRERVLAEDERSGETGEPFSTEFRMVARDGRTVWLREEGRLVGTEGSDSQLWHGVMFDITQLKRAEEALRETETRYRTLVETIPAVTYIQEIHDTSTTVYASPQIKDMLGYTPEECTTDPDHWIQVLHPEDKERVLAEDERTNATGEPFSMEYRQIAKDGRVVWLRDEARVVRDDEGDPAYWLGVQVDITKLKEAEALLRESEERFRSVVQNSSEVVNIVDIDGTVKYASPALERVLGHRSEEFVGQNVLDFVHPDDLPGVARKTQEALREPAVARNEAEYRFRHKDGSWRHMEALGTYLLDDPSVKGVLVTSRDVTKRKEAERKRHEAEVRFRTLVEQVPAIIYAEELSRNGKVLTYMSPQYEALFGYSWEPGVPHPEQWLDKVHPEDRERLITEDARTDETLEPFMAEYRMFTRDGRILWMRDEAVVVRDDNGKPLFWQGIRFDITEQKRADEALKKSESSLAKAQQQAHLGSWEWDLNTGEASFSDEVFRIFGYGPHELSATFENFMKTVHPDDREALERKIDEVIYEGGSYDFEHRVVRPSGEVRVVHCRAEILSGEGGEPLRMVGTVHDITERKELEKQLAHQALHDALTGLPNRSLFVDRLEQALARADRHRGKIAVLFLDVDNFKVVNDSLGHEAGDKLLIEMSRRLRACIRPGDTVARLGGDEFTILLEEVYDLSDAVRVAERIAEELQAPFDLEGQEVFATASIGIALGDLAQSRPANLLRDADLAMYRAKDTGRAHYEVFEPGMNTQARERLKLANDLRRALEQDELKVHYQPQVLLETGRIIGMEALVRWEHPERGLVEPSEFVGIAEETGLILPLGKRVLEMACRQARSWQGRRAGAPAICVNLSARQFQQRDLVDDIARVLRESGLDPSSLVLEITESVVMRDARSSVVTFEGLTNLGVRLAIDDFGTGYSSLSYLRRFPVEYLKIDRSFVEKLGAESGDAVIASGIIGLAHTLGMRVIAEGTETAEQLRWLRELDCDLAQGNYFSKPLPGEAAIVLLKTNPAYRWQDSDTRDTPRRGIRD